MSSATPDFDVSFDWVARCDLSQMSCLWVETDRCGYRFKKTEVGKGPWKIWGKPSGKNFAGSAGFRLYPCSPNPGSDQIRVWIEGCGDVSDKLRRKFNRPGAPSCAPSASEPVLPCAPSRHAFAPAGCISS